MLKVVNEQGLKRRDLHCFVCYNLNLHCCTQFSIFPTGFFSTLQFICPVMYLFCDWTEYYDY